jgi:hypothetical protein
VGPSTSNFLAFPSSFCFGSTIFQFLKCYIEFFHVFKFQYHRDKEEQTNQHPCAKKRKKIYLSEHQNFSLSKRTHPKLLDLQHTMDDNFQIKMPCDKVANPH